MKRLPIFVIALMLLMGAVSMPLHAQYNIGDTLTVKVWKFSTPAKRMSELAYVDTITDHFIILKQARGYPVLSLLLSDTTSRATGVMGTIGYSLAYKFLRGWEWIIPMEDLDKISERMYAVIGSMRDGFYAGGERGVSKALNTTRWYTNEVLTSKVYALAGNPLRSGRNFELYAGTDNGVFRAPTAGAARDPSQMMSFEWDTLGLANVGIWGLAVDPLDTAYIYAGGGTNITVFEGDTVKGGNLLFLYDGTDWVDTVTVGSDSNFIRRLAALPIGDTTFILIATDEGFFWSKHVLGTDELAEPVFEEATAEYAPIMDVYVDENDLLLASYGHGVIRRTSGNLGGTIEWEVLSEGLDTILEANKVTCISVPVPGQYFIGTKAGIYRWDGTAWGSFNPGIIVTDEQMAQFKADIAQIEDDGIIDKMLQIAEVDPSELYDSDGIDKVFVYVTRQILMGGIAQGAYGNVLAYFDPSDATDPEGNGKEFIAVSYNDYAKPQDPNQGIRPFYIPYLYGRYIVWSLDTDEWTSVIAGMALALVDTAYSLNGQPGIVPVGQFGGNSFLLSEGSYIYHPFVWDNDVIEHQRDRERAYLFFDYLWEKFGFDALKRILRSGDDGNVGVDNVLEIYYQTDLDDVITGWHVANLLDKPELDPMFGYERLDFSFSLDSVKAAVAAPNDSSPVYDPVYCGVFWKVANTDSAAIFNATDDAELRVIQFTIEDDSVLAVDTLELDTVTNTYTWTGNESDLYLAVINYKIVAHAWTLLSKDVEPPEVNLYTLPNLGYDRMVNFYLQGNEPIYSDVKVAGPTIVAHTADDTVNYTLGAFDSNDSLYLYFNPVVLPNEWTGDVIFDVWAQDISGNFSAEAVSDTIGILRVGSEGGEFAVLGNEVILSVAPNTFGSEQELMVASVDEDVLAGMEQLPVDLAEEGVSPVYLIGDNSIFFNNPVELRIRYSGSTEGVGLYHYVNGEWRLVDAYADGGYVVAAIDEGGIYQIRRGPGRFETLKFELKKVAPNPISSNSVLTVEFAVPKTSNVKLSVYDATGRLVKRLIDGTVAAGEHSVSWSLGARKIAHGVYFVELRTNDARAVRKLVVLK